MAPRILSEHERIIRDEFDLKGWVQKVPERRSRYFGWCSRAVEVVQEVNGGEEPEHATVIESMLGLLQEDDTFFDHAAKRKNSEFLADGENWFPLRRACAAQIYREYLVAVEKNEWP